MDGGESSYRIDLVGAVLMIVLGIVVVFYGVGYRMGSLTNMGAGYVPVVLGTLLIFMGLLIGITGYASRHRVAAASALAAIFLCVFISALGDRNNSLRDCALLALAITIAGVLIFSVGLKLTFPLFTLA